MSKMLMTLMLTLFAFGGVYAADKAADTKAADKKELTPQQQKMADCSAKNKGKTGDDYKKAQSECLKANGTPAAAAAPKTQQEKMAACSKANKGKTGDDYKKAQSECLKAS
jgi:hypothetical protein